MKEVLRAVLLTVALRLCLESLEIPMLLEVVLVLA